MATEDPYERLLGRRKLGGKADTWDVPPSGPLFPIELAEDRLHAEQLEETGSSGPVAWRRIQAELLDSSRARVTDPDHIVLLRSRGCYGYLPSEERLLMQQSGIAREQIDTDDERSDESDDPSVWTDVREDKEISDSSRGKSELYLTDEEIVFLFYALGCLDVTLPTIPVGDDSDTISNPLRLWFYLCSGRLTDHPIEPSVARTQNQRFRIAELDLLRRYAAYLYYRARGWIVRPGLALGGVHMLLYAQGPSHRHAAFAVLVDRANPVDSDGAQVTCAEMAAHVRVVHSVGKRLILCRVRLPSLDMLQSNPWDAIRQSTITETLIDHWTPSSR